MTIPKEKMPITYEAMYEELLDVTEGFANDGASVFDIANLMSRFVTEMAFDCAPCQNKATHLLLSAITDRIERDHDTEDGGDND